MQIKLQPASGSELPAFNPLLPPAVVSQVLLLANPHKVLLLGTGILLAACVKDGRVLITGRGSGETGQSGLCWEDVCSAQRSFQSYSLKDCVGSCFRGLHGCGLSAHRDSSRHPLCRYWQLMEHKGWVADLLHWWIIRRPKIGIRNSLSLSRLARPVLPTFPWVACTGLPVALVS